MDQSHLSIVQVRQSCSDVLLHCSHVCAVWGVRGGWAAWRRRDPGREGGREGGRYSLTLRRGVDGLRVSIYVYVWTYPAWVCAGWFPWRAIKYQRAQRERERQTDRVGREESCRSGQLGGSFIAHGWMDGWMAGLSIYLSFVAAIHPSLPSSLIDRSAPIQSTNKAGAEGLVPTSLPCISSAFIAFQST